MKVRLIKALILVIGGSLAALPTHGQEKAEAPERFSITEEPGKHLDVLWQNKPLFRFQTAYDASSKESLEETKKVYAHVFDSTGKETLTKGAGGLFPHHRGIYLGWSKTGFGGKNYDTWHMHKGEAQIHQDFPIREAGAEEAKFTTKILWQGDADTKLLDEERTFTLTRPAEDGSFSVDVQHALKASYGPIKLDGDPEHAGCQFRPHNEVAKAKNATYLYHKEGIDPKKDKDLPWVTLHFKLRGEEYTVQHMCHPTIPKGNTWSAYRDYGRFGPYFVKNLDRDETLTLRYRFHIAKGKLEDRSVYQKRYEAFAK